MAAVEIWETMARGRFHGCSPWGDKVINEIKEPWRRVDLGEEEMGSVG